MLLAKMHTVNIQTIVFTPFELNYGLIFLESYIHALSMDMTSLSKRPIIVTVTPYHEHFSLINHMALV